MLLDAKVDAVLTVDLEDYRYQYLRDNIGYQGPYFPEEVTHQVDALLVLFEKCGARATFFTVGSLTTSLPRSVWGAITEHHMIGCHGHAHYHVSKQGPRKFREDLQAATAALEDVAGRRVISYRAPYFSADGCDPWFGEILVDSGIKIDSSKRFSKGGDAFGGTYLLPHTGNSVIEVPLYSLGFGVKRITVIGGTYLRLFPLPVIESLLKRARTLGFIPLVYLHPYDIDPSAVPLAYPRRTHWKAKAWDALRRFNRETVEDKLLALSQVYRFRSAEDIVGLT